MDKVQAEHVICTVDSFKPPLLIVKTVLKEKEERTLAFTRQIKENSEWHIRKLVNVSQFLKEYESLQFVEELALADALINPEETGTVAPVFKLPKPLLSFFQSKLDEYQVAAITKGMRRLGITLVSGSAGTGKTEVLAASVLAFMNVIDESELMRPKKHTIAELLKEDDSDYADDYVRDPVALRKIMPWLGPDYSIGKLSAEDLTLEKRSVSYQKAASTDMKLVLKKKDFQEYSPPENLLICCSTSKALDRFMHRVLELNSTLSTTTSHRRSQGERPEDRTLHTPPSWGYRGRIAEGLHHRNAPAGEVLQTL